MTLKPRVFCINCSLIFIFLLFLHAGFAQYDFSEAEKLLTARKKSLGGKVVVLAYKDGKPILQKETGEEFKSETVEPIGASSKWLTAALVMTFVDKGELSLDDPVSKYLPVFASYSKSYITVRHCLAEVTGIESAQKKLATMLTKKKFTTLEEEVNYFAAHKDIVANPGKEYFYGEAGFNIVGRILEVISKRKTFSKLMQERITKPLLMKKTTFAKEQGSENPSTGAVSTAGDYLKFMVMLLNNGEYNGKRILSKESILEMEKVQFSSLPVKNAPKVAQGFQYGLGVWIQETDQDGRSSVISCPGIYGTWPYVDRCRNYACIIFTQQLDTEQNPNIYLEIKDEIEKQLKPACR